MADRAHEITEKIIKDTEKRLRREYEQAAKELEEKLNDYFRRFKIKDEKWQQWVKQGKKTEKEYKQWRTGQMAVGKRWRQMKDTIAEDMRNTNDIARKICRDQQVDIYAINHAFGTYQIEHSGGINTSYTLYNHEAVENILKNDPELLPPPGKKTSKAIAENKAKRWARQTVQSTITQGIMQGDSIPKLARRLATNVADKDYKAAIRNARTMATSAQNAGRYEAYRRARDMGIDLTIEWAATLDDRTRHSHRQMHGQRREVDEPFIVVDGGRTFYIMWPADCNSSQSNAPQQQIWNCFVGETNVASDSKIVRSYKHEYSGELITVKTASGVNFTCTPNHPILTPFGWVPAARLHKGDDLLVTSIGDSGCSFGDSDINHVHPTFEALHGSLVEFGLVDNVSMPNFNFHGDIPTSDVEVVSEERLLRSCFDTGISEGINELLFKNANPLVTCKRHFMAGFRRVYISTLRLMSRRRKALTLFWGRLRHSDVHGLGAVTGGNTGIPQNTVNNLSAMSNIGGERLDGLTGNVFVDDIVSVHRHTGRHVHVYNLQTENGYYFVNNIIDQNGQKCNGNYAIAHNCRCTLLSWVKGFEHDMLTDSDKMTMDFDDWLKVEPGKEKFQPILKQYETGEAIKMQYVRKYRNG